MTGKPTYEQLEQNVKELEKEAVKPKQIERALRASDRLLSQIVEGSPIPTFVIDKKHIVTHWNKACENLTGIPVNEVIGTQKQWLAFYSTERPVMADLVVDNKLGEETALYYGNKYRESAVIEGAYEAEDFFPDLGDKGKWLFFTAAPLKNAEAKVVGAIETLQDLSEHKQAEKELLESQERYRTVLEACPDPVVVYDMAGKAVYVNPAFTSVFGWQLDELLGRKMDYVPEENGPETQTMIDKVLAGESFSGIESRRYTKERNIVDVSISAATYLDRDGNPAGSVHILRDITDQKRLEARLKAGEKILKLQKDLEERNKKLSESNKELSQAYSVIKRDLEAGAKIQSSLMPQAPSTIYRVQFDSIFLPSTFVAGDIFNYFKLDEHHVGFYVLDVAGHGIPAAMLSVALSKALCPTNDQERLLKQFMPAPEPPYYRITNPAMAVQALNKRFQADANTMQYFTMVYGFIDARNGQTVMTLAGHPPPIFLKKGAEASLIGTGGYPVGMLPDVEYAEEEVKLNKGDRLILYSDGITECTNSNQVEFSVERLIDILEKGHNLPLRELMERIEQGLRLWRGNNDFEDDMTLLAIEVV